MCIFCERAQRQLAADGGQGVAGALTTAQKLEAEGCDTLNEKRIRATILTGFLGAGKTTFLNFILKSVGHQEKLAVVQNEFGSVSVDDKLMLVERNDTEVVVMPNGCICCRVRGDLVEALRKLAQRPTSLAGDGPALNGLIIECSGLSEVMPVAQTFFADPFVQEKFRLDGVICVCDAANFEQLEASTGEGSTDASIGELLREQLSICDVCLLNKCDLVDSSKRDRISARIKALNPSVRVVPCRHGKVNLGQVLKIDSFSLKGAMSLDAHFLESAAEPTTGGHGGGHGDAHGHTVEDTAPRRHAHESFCSIGLECDASVDREALEAWLESVVTRLGSGLIRCKGVLRLPAAKAARLVVHGVGGHIEIAEDEGETPATSRMVFIGKLADWALRKELKEGFEATHLKPAG